MSVIVGDGDERCRATAVDDVLECSVEGGFWEFFVDAIDLRDVGGTRDRDEVWTETNEVAGMAVAGV